MTDPPSDWRFPTVCPACLARSGNPVSLAESADSMIIVCVQCDGCAFQWLITGATPPLILKQKPDRRVD